MTKLSEIKRPLDGELQNGDAEFYQVSIDSRTIKPGELFFALTGPNFDGHDFITMAQEKGAAAAVVSRSIKAGIPVLQVADTRIALGKLAALHRQKFPIPLIALTGSCGKTTVKEMLRSILQEKGEVLASQGTLNNDYGVPLTLLKLTAAHQFAVIEMGANHAGEIAYLTALAKPRVALINNVAPAHLAGFGDIAGVARAKGEIFQGLSAEGIAIINADDAFADYWSNQLGDKKILRFGKSHNADFTARDWHADANYCFSFTLCSPSGEIAITLPLPGEHQINNALAAAAATTAIGVSLATIKAGLEKTHPVTGRLLLRQGINNTHIFDDSYNANPGSVAAALQVLAQRPGQRVFVMGEMRELGEHEAEYHADIGQLAKKLGIHYLYAYGDLTRFAAAAFGTGSYHFASQADLIKALQQILQPEMTVLVKGSLSTQMKNVVVALIKD